MYLNGAILTYIGTWSTTFLEGADKVTANVVSALGTNGLVSRTPPVVNAGLISTLGGPFGVTLQLQIENGVGFNSPDDIIAIIRHQVYQETSSFPTSDSIPQVQQTDGSIVQTGQPAAPATSAQTGCIAGTSSDLSNNFDLGCWFKNLTTGGLTTVGILALLAVLGVVILSQVPKPIRA